MLGGEDLAGVLDALLEGVQIIGKDWRYLYVNCTAARHGRREREALLGRTMMECYPGIEHTEVFGLLRSAMTMGRQYVAENTFTFPDGSIGYFELRIQPVPQGVCVLSLDISERRNAAERLRRTEEAVRETQKMEAVGRLAGGIAHDFNNILSVILAHSDLLLRELHPAEPMRQPLGEIFRAGRRAADLTQQLLAFSRRQVLEMRPLDLNAVLDALAPMLDRLVGDDVQVSISLHPRLWTCAADSSQIEQVVMNLVVNARDAMPRGGIITIETSNIELDEAYAAQHREVQAGEHVLLAVTDNGSGMDEETQARAFEPFFTTKEKGRGTGLGLATVFGIVKQSRGHVWLYSEPGHGTTFKVYLPRTRERPRQAVNHVAEPPPARGTETVLLVEDDDQVRAVLRRLLSHQGYEILEATSSGDAILIAEQHETPIHLLLTDVVMPRMSGHELALRLRSERPEMRVLYMSGYTENAIVHHGLADGSVHLLQKPIIPDTLLRKVREVLDLPLPQSG